MSSAEKWASKFQYKHSWVFVPTEETARYGKSVKLSIEKCWFAPDFYYHLRDGGHVKALKSHIGHRFFIHLDIKDFFGSINRSRVTRCLKDFFEYTIAREIAVASTVRLPESSIRKYILPFGFVQSPIIASICLHKSRLSKCLYNLNKLDGVIVSVYMDDIIISGNDFTSLQKVLDEVKVAAERSGFPLNPEKEEGPSEKITAFNIELSHGLLKITDSRFNDFYDTYKVSDNINQRQGIIGYVSSVNQEQVDDLH